MVVSGPSLPPPRFLSSPLPASLHSPQSKPVNEAYATSFSPASFKTGKGSRKNRFRGTATTKAFTKAMQTAESTRSDQMAVRSKTSLAPQPTMTALDAEDLESEGESSGRFTVPQNTETVPFRRGVSGQAISISSPPTPPSKPVPAREEDRESEPDDKKRKGEPNQRRRDGPQKPRTRGSKRRPESERGPRRRKTNNRPNNGFEKRPRNSSWLKMIDRGFHDMVDKFAGLGSGLVLMAPFG